MYGMSYPSDHWNSKLLLTSPFLYSIYLITLISSCNSSNVNISIEQAITCNSSVNGSISSSQDIKYYSLNVNTTISAIESVFISVCTPSDEFAAILYVFDTILNQDSIKYTVDSCNSIQFDPLQDQYIIAVATASMETSPYHIEISCNLPTPKPTGFYTTPGT